MAIISIITVLAFGTVLCLVEIPGIRQEKSAKELWVFLILLFLGVISAILQSLHVTLPNPSDLLEWIYTPTSDMMKAFWGIK